jgi:hypothetical protein
MGRTKGSVSVPTAKIEQVVKVMVRYGKNVREAGEYCNASYKAGWTNFKSLAVLVSRYRATHK